MRKLHFLATIVAIAAALAAFTTSATAASPQSCSPAPGNTYPVQWNTVAPVAVAAGSKFELDVCLVSNTGSMVKAVSVTMVPPVGNRSTSTVNVSSGHSTTIKNNVTAPNTPGTIEEIDVTVAPPGATPQTVPVLISIT